MPYIDPAAVNPMKAHAVEFLKTDGYRDGGSKSIPAILTAFFVRRYKSIFFDKLQLLIESKLIKGTFENGTEYTIVATILNMPKDIVRLIQKFDFTKKNPKLIYVNTGEKMISLEDTILTAF